MGQTSSVPVDGAHHRGPPNPTLHMDSNRTPAPRHVDDAKKETLKIPSAWKTKSQHRRTNSDNFVMVSPQSDISNPSHFRGLFVHQQKPHGAGGPVTHANTGTQPAKYHHRRTSKVISKISPPPYVKQKLYSTMSHPRTSNLQTPPPPIPARFYFQGHDEDDDDNEDDEHENADNVINIQKEQEKKNTDSGEDGEKPFASKTPSKNLEVDFAPPHANKISKKSSMSTTKKKKKKGMTISSKFTRKCIKAKTALSECWKDHVLQNEEPPPNVQRHYSQRQVATMPQQLLPSQNTNGKPFVTLMPQHVQHNATSFQPVWKESKMVLSSSSPDDQNHTSCNEDPNKERVGWKANRVTEPTTVKSSSISAVVPTGHVRDIIRTFSQETNTSTVLQPSKTATTTSGTTAVSTIVQLYPPYSMKESDKQFGAIVETTAESIFRPTSTSDKNQLPTKIDVHPTLTTSTSATSEASSLKSSSTSSTKQSKKNQTTEQPSLKRASIEKKMNRRQTAGSHSTSSTNVTKFEPSTFTQNRRRSEVSIEMQRQIDQQLSGVSQSISVAASKKVQRLRQQYHEEILEKKSQLTKTNEPTRVPIMDTVLSSMSRTMTVAEARKAFESNNHQSLLPSSSTKSRNATSVPNRKSYEYDNSHKIVDNSNVKVQPQVSTGFSTMVSNTTNRRSISVPRGGRTSRPSIDQSALLHLSKSWDGAGSNKNRLSQSLSQPTAQLPVLLQMAGWKAPDQGKPKKSISKIGMSRSTATHHGKSNSTRSEVSKGATQAPTTTIQVAMHRPDPELVVSKKITKKAKSFDHATNSTTQRMNESVPIVRKSTGNISNGGRTIAYMLQQAYFGNDSDDDEDGTNYVKHILSPETRVNALVECSPALSVESASTHNSIPVVSEQAFFNADFLFSQDGYNMYARTTESSTGNTKLLLESDKMNCNDNVFAACIEDQNGPSAFKLSTMDSRSRIITSTSSVSSTIATIVQHPSHVETTSGPVLTERPEGSLSLPRRVRFSDESLLIKNEDTTGVHLIERKFSDLTDVTVATQVQQIRVSTAGSANTSVTIPRIDSIPEEEEDNMENEQATTPDKGNSASAIMRWSYRTSATLSTSSSSSEERGVTPLLGNKAKSTTTNGSPQEINKKQHQRTTNSPYLRFQQAKQRFTSSSASTGIAMRKVVPQKRTSPIRSIKKSNAIVAARIASMEKKKRQGFVRCSSSIDSSTLFEAAPLNKDNTDVPKYEPSSQGSFLQRVQRRLQPASSPKPDDTTLATHSPLVLLQPRCDETDDASYHGDSDRIESSNSPVLINGQVISSPLKLKGHLTTGLTTSTNTLDESASVVSYDSDDVFGAILHPTTIDDSDEENDAGQSHGGDDEFDRVLNYTESFDDEQQTSMNMHHEELGQRKVLPSSISRDTAGSVASVASSSGDTASVVPHWLLQHGGRHRSSVVTTTSDTSSVMSAVSRMKNIHSGSSINGVSQPLPFREIAQVKPVEQHRQPNQLETHEMKSKVVPPRTWRKLAVAAQKEDMKHLHHSSGTTKENASSGDNKQQYRSVHQQRFLYDRSNLQ